MNFNIRLKFNKKSDIINQNEENQMVDNRGVTPVSSFNFKSGDISGTAAKTSEEKMGQGNEYYAQDNPDNEQENNENNYQDRSAQLRASLDSLAMANAGSMMLMKTIKKREQEKNKKVQNERKAYPDAQEKDNNETNQDDEIINNS